VGDDAGVDLEEARARLAEHPLVADVTLSVDGDGLVTASVVPLDPFRVPRLADLLAHLGRDAPAEVRPRKLTFRSR
jgi:hypothetical protein